MRIRTSKKNKSDLLKTYLESQTDLTTNINKALFNRFFHIIEKNISNHITVELRNFGTFRTTIQKASIRRNPKTGEKVNVPKKRTIKWKMSKELFKKLNNENE